MQARIAEMPDTCKGFESSSSVTVFIKGDNVVVLLIGLKSAINSFKLRNAQRNGAKIQGENSKLITGVVHSMKLKYLDIEENEKERNQQWRQVSLASN